MIWIGSPPVADNDADENDENTPITTDVMDNDCDHDDESLNNHKLVQ